MPLRAPTGAETGLPLFAQPVNGSPMRPVSGRVEAALPRSVAGIVAVVAVLTLIAAARRDHAQTAGRTATPTTTRANEAQSLDDEKSASRRPLSFYTGTVRGSMFNPPAPPAQPKPKAAPKPKVKPIPQPVVKPQPIITLPPINPLADWSYTGTIKMGDRTLALLENSKTNEGQYVQAGENFMGQDITSITDQQVTLMSGGKPTMLAKSDNITVKQLDRPAPVAAPAAPANPAVPQQGGQVQGMINMAPSNGPMVVLPNGRVLTGQGAARRARFMNRNFNR